MIGCHPGRRRSAPRTRDPYLLLEILGPGSSKSCTHDFYGRDDSICQATNAAHPMKLKRIPRALRMMRDSMLGRTRHNQELAVELNIYLDPSQKIRLPNHIFELARLHGDPELAIHLEFPIAAADLIINELDAVCQHQKDRAEIQMTSSSVLILERLKEYVGMTYKSGLQHNSQCLRCETLKEAVKKYRDKRQNYAPDGTYQLNKKAGQ